jgi:hypothetical protein
MVVCELACAITYHLRNGEYKHCGQQDTMTLCGEKPAWDTRIPVTMFDSALLDQDQFHLDHPHTRICGDCLKKYRELKGVKS